MTDAFYPCASGDGPTAAAAAGCSAWFNALTKPSGRAIHYPKKRVGEPIMNRAAISNLRVRLIACIEHGVPADPQVFAELSALLDPLCWAPYPASIQARATELRRALGSRLSRHRWNAEDGNEAGRSLRAAALALCGALEEFDIRSAPLVHGKAPCKASSLSA